MKTLLTACLLFLALSAPARAQTALTLTWQPTSLQVDYGAPEPVCVWLVGGGLPDARVAGPCVPGGQIRLPYAGTDHNLTPLGRSSIELRGVNGVVARRVLTPPGRAVLPLIIKGEAARWEVRLVLVVN